MPTRNEIITELYDSREFNECIGKMDPDYLRDDLRSEVMLALLEMDESIIQELHRSNGIRYYTVRIILNLIKSKTSRFYKTYRRYALQIVENNKSLGILDYNDTEIPIAWGKSLQQHYASLHNQCRDDLRERLRREGLGEKAINIINDPTEDVVNGLAWYERQIVRLYLTLGSYRKIEKETRIPHESCYSTVQKAIKILRNELKTV